SSRDLHCSELFLLVCTDRVQPSVRSVATLSGSAEGAVPRLTGFNPVRLPLRRDSALLFREGLRNLVSCVIFFRCRILFRGAVLKGAPTSAGRLSSRSGASGRSSLSPAPKT